MDLNKKERRKAIKKGKKVILETEVLILKTLKDLNLTKEEFVLLRNQSEKNFIN